MFPLVSKRIRQWPFKTKVSGNLLHWMAYLWNSPPKEFVEAGSLEVLKEEIDNFGKNWRLDGIGAEVEARHEAEQPWLLLLPCITSTALRPSSENSLQLFQPSPYSTSPPHPVTGSLTCHPHLSLQLQTQIALLLHLNLLLSRLSPACSPGFTSLFCIKAARDENIALQR